MQWALLTSTSSRSHSASSRAGSTVNTSPDRASFSNNDRPGAPGGRRPGIVWFRSDLRLDDNEALNRATAECSSVLPVYCFDPRDYSRSPQGYDRTGPYRASFLIQAVADLRDRLKAAGSDLVIRIGRPEEVIAELARRVGAAAVYCHAEVTFEEQQVEKKVFEAVKSTGAQLHSFWTNTLHSMEDLPFNLAEMPQNFDKFRVSMASVVPKIALSAPEQLRGLPVGAKASFDLGEIPTLKQLGLQPLPEGSSSTSEGNCKGGETEGLRQLKEFLTTAAGATQGKPARPGAAHASSFSSCIAPWLATGCLSPRRMLQEAQSVLEKGRKNTAAEGAAASGTGGSLQWVQFELLWRDFFRLLTRRHSEVVLPRAKEAIAASATAAPALAMA